MPFFPILALILGVTTIAGTVAAAAEKDRADSESRKRQAEAANFQRERERMSSELAAKESRLQALEAKFAPHSDQVLALVAEISRLRVQLTSLRSQARIRASVNTQIARW